MNPLRSVWGWLSKTKNQKTLAITGIGLSAVIWVAQAYLFYVHASKELYTIATETKVPPTEEKFPIDHILQEMQWGNIAFNAPTSMNLKETARLQLLLGIKQTIEELEQNIKIEIDKAHLSGGIERARIKVASLMQAHLESSDFDVKPITPEEQPISSEVTTEWLWEAKPKSDGIHSLYLTLNAKLLVQNTAIYKAIRTFYKEIKVEVTKPQQIRRFIKDNWQWLWTTILAPVCIWLWNKSKSSRDDRSPR